MQEIASPPTRSSNFLATTESARRAPATLPRPVLSLRSLLVGWFAVAAWALVLVSAVIDGDQRRGLALTQLVAGAAGLGVCAAICIAHDVLSALRVRRGPAGEDEYWAGYADCAKALLGERRPQASPGGRPGHRPRPTRR
jgi:hypothetical protein